MRSEWKSCVLISVVCTLMLFGCVEVSDPPDYRQPESDVTMPEDDVGSDSSPTNAASHPSTTGSMPDALVSPVLLARQQHPQQLTTGEHALIWTNYDSATNTGAIKMVLHGETTVRTLAGAVMPVGVVTDQDNIYWADMGAGAIMKLATDGTLTKLAINLSAPFYVAVDADDVYFTDVEAGTVARVSKDGGVVKVLATGQRQPSTIAVATNAAGVREVYWANLGDAGELMAMPVSGGSARVLSAGHDFSNGFVVDSGNIYWSDAAARTVTLYSTKFGKTDVRASNQYGAAGLAADATNIYWITQHDGAIHAMNKLTGAAKTLASGQDTPKQLVVSDTTVYWADAEYGSVFALAK